MSVRLLKNHTEMAIMLPSMPYWCADANVLLHLDYEPISGHVRLTDVQVRDFDLCEWDRASRRYNTRCNVVPTDDGWDVVKAIKQAVRNKVNLEECRNWCARQEMEEVG